MLIKILPFLAICTFVNTNLYSSDINMQNNNMLQNHYNIKNSMSNTQDKQTQTDMIMDIDSDSNLNQTNNILQSNNHNLFKIKFDINNNKQVSCIGNTDNKKQFEQYEYSHNQLSIIPNSEEEIKVNKNINMQNKHYPVKNRALNNINKNISSNKMVPGVKVGQGYYFNIHYIMNEYFKNNCKVGIYEIVRRAHKAVNLQDKVIINDYDLINDNINDNDEIIRNDEVTEDDKKIIESQNTVNLQGKIIINNYEVTDNNIYMTPNSKQEIQSYNNDPKYYNIKNIVGNDNNYIVNNGKNLLDKYDNDNNMYNYRIITPPNNHNKPNNMIIISISPTNEQNSDEEYNNNKYEDLTNTKKNLLEQFNECAEDKNTKDNIDSTNYNSYKANNNKSIDEKDSNEIKNNMYNSIFSKELED